MYTYPALRAYANHAYTCARTLQDPHTYLVHAVAQSRCYAVTRSRRYTGTRAHRHTYVYTSAPHRAYMHTCLYADRHTQ